MQSPYQQLPPPERGLISRSTRITFIAGLIVGIVIGWLAHNIINVVITFLIVAAILAVVIGLFLAWRWAADRQRPDFPR
jgi:F0F1-type ATP synthase assembly protein I